MNAKVTFFTKYQAQGASFSLYKVVSSFDDLILPQGNTYSPVDKLMRIWMQLMGEGVQGGDIRVSEEGVSGDSVFFNKNYLSYGSASVPPSGSSTIMIKCIEESAPDFFDTSALISLYATSTQKGRIYMRFIPDTIINYPVGLNPNQNWLNKFALLRACIVNDGWCVRCAAPWQTNGWKTIVSLTRSIANANITVTTLEAHNWVIGNQVRISDVAGFANGIYKIADFGPIAANQVLLLDTPGTALNVGGKGYGRMLTYGLVDITNCDLRRVTRRKAGRPFGALAGRR